MIVLKPEGGPKVVLLAAAGVAAGAFAHLVWQWPLLGSIDRIMLMLAALVFGLWAMDGLQRRYEICSRRIRARHLFFWWRVWNLPDELRIHTDRFGRLVLSDRRGRIVALPRQYNRLGELEKRFWHMRVFTDPVS
jgi:hypothetical protein